MSTSFQYRLQQFESTPPDESWQVISKRLGEEFQTTDSLLSAKLTGFFQEPPTDLWSAINTRLPAMESDSDLQDPAVHSGWPAGDPAFADKAVSEHPAARPSEIRYTTEQGKPAKVIHAFNWRRLAAAAAVIGISLSVLYYFASKSEMANQLSATTNPVKTKVAEPKVNLPIEGTEPVVIAPVTSMGMSTSKLFKKPAKSSMSVLTASAQQASPETEDPNVVMTYANVKAPDPVVSEKDIVIPNEPIRDNNGNIIMDEKLVSAPDVNYVTVTGPNGEQTKISKKFLHALSYMNAVSDDDHLGIALQESSMWKWLFKEWRQKLLNQPTFIPSTTNFLDIMELKEILHENF
ncbi:hypothetical protein ACX0G7_26140 [Flavitalea antarctica]